MLSDVSFGRYYPTKSFIHRLDPRVKLLLLIAYIVMIFLAKNFLTLGFAYSFVPCGGVFGRTGNGGTQKP